MSQLPEEIKATIPAELISAVEALNKTLGEAHFRCGEPTKVFGYGLLHHGAYREEMEEEKSTLMELKMAVGPAAVKSYESHLKMETTSALFHAMHGLYEAGVILQAVQVFHELLEIGNAHAKELRRPPIRWARDLTLELVRTHAHRVKIWIRDVCDPLDFNTDRNWADPDEAIMGKTWCAPMLLVMRPSRFMPFDASRQWERTDHETSKKWLNQFAQGLTFDIMARLDRLADERTVELAQRPNSVQAVAGQISVKQKYRSLKIGERNRNIQSEFKKLQKRKPNMSGVWYSEQLAKSKIADGLNAETIRKIIRG